MTEERQEEEWYASVRSIETKVVVAKKKKQKSLRGMTGKQQAAKQKHKDKSRGKQRNSQTDKES